jgi:hypothetical protein
MAMTANINEEAGASSATSTREEEDAEPAPSSSSSSVFDAGGFVVDVGKKSSSASTSTLSLSSSSSFKRMRPMDDQVGSKKNSGLGGGFKISNDEDANANVDDNESTSSSLEDFEQNGASLYITQTEAQRTYCLPLGTLAVCTFIEKDNPRSKGFAKMKLYLRTEVRQRARKRFGGKEGLIKERERRKTKQLQQDLDDMKNIFC